MQTAPNKRIVSKGEYAWRRALTLLLSGMVFFCGFWLVLLIPDTLYKEKVALFGGWRGCIQPDPVRVLLGGFIYTSFLSAAMKVLRIQKHKSIDVLRELQPLTRANTADLPALDSLVRASQEPVQAQETVLLRAVAQGQQTPAEQLVRSSGKWE